jgi:adenosylmethionine-8-amino-7-oxononanoate aminotransferase
MIHSVSRLGGSRGPRDHVLYSAWRTWQHIRRVRHSDGLLGFIFTLSFRNPLGCAVAMTSLRVLVDEKLADRAQNLGEIFRAGILAFNSPLVKEVRGRGLLNAVVIDEEKSSKGRTAWQFCLLLKSRGVLAKPTHCNMYVT